VRPNQNPKRGGQSHVLEKRLGVAETLDTGSRSERVHDHSGGHRENASAGLSSKCRRHGRCEIGLRRTAQPVLMIAIGTGFATASHFLPRLSSGILAFRRKVSGRSAQRRRR
jgi:hypothetical protein